MNSRERELAVIRHKLPDRIPADVIRIEIIPEIANYLKTSQDAVLGLLGIDGKVVCTTKYLGKMPTESNEETLDEWGTAANEEYGFTHRYPLSDVESLASIDCYPWPDPSRYDFEEAAAMAGTIAHAGLATRGPFWQPVFCRLCSLFGMEETMIRMMNEPVLFQAALDRIMHFEVEYCRQFIDQLGTNLDIFCLGDDFATQRGLLISPELWRMYLKPCYAKIFSLAKKAGKPVWFHSCGDITSVLPDLIDIGMDVWETVQLHTLPMAAYRSVVITLGI
jgi:hypothetical protein